MTTLAVTAPQVSASGAVITAVMAVLTGTVAIATLINLRRDSRDRTRPVVVANLNGRVINPGTVEFNVTNIGSTIARDVQVTFTPALAEQPAGFAGQKPLINFVRERYAQPILTLAPHHRLNNIWSHLAPDAEQGETLEPVPIRFTVRITYNDGRGHDYTDSYNLDSSVLTLETMAYPGNTQPEKVQQRIARAIELIANGVGEI